MRIEGNSSKNIILCLGRDSGFVGAIMNGFEGGERLGMGRVCYHNETHTSTHFHSVKHITIRLSRVLKVSSGYNACFQLV